VIPMTWKCVDSLPGGLSVVAPDERLSWLRTVGIGAQHVVAMFGATFLVPVLTGFPPATTLLFSGVGTLLFLVITGNRLPSYLGSSFSVIAPVTAAVASNGRGSALGGLVAVGLSLVVIGVAVHFVGTRWLEVALPPVVTGAIVALIGLNLAPAAKTNFEKGPLLGTVTLVLMVCSLAFFRGILGRLAIFTAVVAGICWRCRSVRWTRRGSSPRRGWGCRNSRRRRSHWRCSRCFYLRWSHWWRRTSDTSSRSVR
jgi:xanthine/uracil permease